MSLEVPHTRGQTGWALYLFGIEASVYAWGNFEIFATKTGSHQVFFPHLHQGLPLVVPAHMHGADLPHQSANLLQSQIA